MSPPAARPARGSGGRRGDSLGAWDSLGAPGPPVGPGGRTRTPRLPPVLPTSGSARRPVGGRRAGTGRGSPAPAAPCLPVARGEGGSGGGRRPPPAPPLGAGEPWPRDSPSHGAGGLRGREGGAPRLHGYGRPHLTSQPLSALCPVPAPTPPPPVFLTGLPGQCRDVVVSRGRGMDISEDLPPGVTVNQGG